MGPTALKVPLEREVIWPVKFAAAPERRAERFKPVNVGLAPLWISCGSDRIICPALLVTFTWLAVAVNVDNVGTPEPSPISSYPLVSTFVTPIGEVPLP